MTNFLWKLDTELNAVGNFVIGFSEINRNALHATLASQKKSVVVKFDYQVASLEWCCSGISWPIHTL